MVTYNLERGLSKTRTQVRILIRNQERKLGPFKDFIEAIEGAGDSISDKLQEQLTTREIVFFPESGDEAPTIEEQAAILVRAFLTPPVLGDVPEGEYTI